MSGSAYGTNPSGGEQELAFFDGNKSSSLQGDMGATQQSGGSDNPFSNTSNMQPMSTNSSNETSKQQEGGMVDYFKKSLLLHSWFFIVILHNHLDPVYKYEILHGHIGSVFHTVCDFSTRYGSMCKNQ